MKYRKNTIYVIDISHLWKEFLHQWYYKQTQALWNITLYTTSTIKEQQNTMYTQPGYRRFVFFHLCWMHEYLWIRTLCAFIWILVFQAKFMKGLLCLQYIFHASESCLLSWIVWILVQTCAVRICLNLIIQAKCMYG